MFPWSIANSATREPAPKFHSSDEQMNELFAATCDKQVLVSRVLAIDFPLGNWGGLLERPLSGAKNRSCFSLSLPLAEPDALRRCREDKTFHVRGDVHRWLAVSSSLFLCFSTLLISEATSSSFLNHEETSPFEWSLTLVPSWADLLEQFLASTSSNDF